MKKGAEIETDDHNKRLGGETALNDDDLLKEATDEMNECSSLMCSGNGTTTTTDTSTGAEVTIKVEPKSTTPPMDDEVEKLFKLLQTDTKKVLKGFGDLN